MHVRSEALHTKRTPRGNTICVGDTKTPASSTHGTRSKSSTANPTTPTKTITQNQELQLGKQEFHSLPFANAWRPTRSQIITSTVPPSAHRQFKKQRSWLSPHTRTAAPYNKEFRNFPKRTAREFQNQIETKLGAHVPMQQASR